MNPEKKSILKQIVGFLTGGSLVWIIMAIFNSGIFVATTKATNSYMPQLEEKFSNHRDEDKAFQMSILLQMKEVSYQMRRRNDLDSIYHSIELKKRK